MKRSTYLELVRHSEKCLDCMRWLLQTDGGEELCAHGRQILKNNLLTDTIQPVPELELVGGRIDRRKRKKDPMTQLVRPRDPAPGLKKAEPASLDEAELRARAPLGSEVIRSHIETTESC
jgi:hypothetical protein